MENLFHNTKQFLVTDFIASGILCVLAMMLIVLVWRKRENLSPLTKYVITPLLIFMTNSLLTDTINFNKLLKMYNTHSVSDSLNCYTVLHDGYLAYVTSFVALFYIFITIEREEDQKLNNNCKHSTD